MDDGGPDPMRDFRADRVPMRHGHRKRLDLPKRGKAAIKAEIQGQGTEVLRGRSAFKHGQRGGKHGNMWLPARRRQKLRRETREDAAEYDDPTERVWEMKDLEDEADFDEEGSTYSFHDAASESEMDMESSWSFVSCDGSCSTGSSPSPRDAKGSLPKVSKEKGKKTSKQKPFQKLEPFDQFRRNFLEEQVCPALPACAWSATVPSAKMGQRVMSNAGLKGFLGALPTEDRQLITPGDLDDDVPPRGRFPLRKSAFGGGSWWIYGVRLRVGRYCSLMLQRKCLETAVAGAQDNGFLKWSSLDAPDRAIQTNVTSDGETIKQKRAWLQRPSLRKCSFKRSVTNFAALVLNHCAQPSDTCFAMDALHCATFLCTYPLNCIAASLSITAVALARGGIYLRSALAAYMFWILLDPSPTKGGYEPLDVWLRFFDLTPIPLTTDLLAVRGSLIVMRSQAHQHRYWYGSEPQSGQYDLWSFCP
eukprot:Skav202308  [mRNA]  locus=scaffold60:110190:121641:+ [translate_table: standard]